MSCDYANIGAWQGKTSLSAQRPAETGSEPRLMVLTMTMETFLGEPRGRANV